MRRWLLALCALQLMTTLERQVFDFLGFMWAPILANFFNILFIIFGIFGAFQCVAKYVLSYAIWNLAWFGWNAFVACFYLNVGILSRDEGILALGTGSVSWWEVNGWGCKARWDNVEGNSWSRPTHVEGCFMHFAHVEALHATIQCFFGCLAFIAGLCYAARLRKSDSGSTRGMTKSPGTQSLYSVEFTRPPEIRVEPATKPMTPRRVKRRSVSSRHSTRRSSRRSSQRRNGSSRHAATGSGHTNPTYRQSSRNSLNDSLNNDDDLYNNRPASVRSSYSNFHGARPISMHVAETASYRNEGYLQQQHPPSSPSPSGEATPQVPQKRNNINTIIDDPSPTPMPYRIYSNQNAFLNNGPPAYHLHQMSHYSPPPDTETVM